MEEPYPNCLQCKHLLNHIDSMKHTLRSLEQILELKQERLNTLMSYGIMTEAIYHQIRLVAIDRSIIDRLMTELASKYTEYGDHLLYDHNDEEDED